MPANSLTKQETLLGDLRHGLCSSGLCKQLRGVAADEIERLTECRRADAEHLALEVSEREARGREIETLKRAYNEVINRLRRVDVWQMELNDICEGKYDATDKCSAVEPPGEYK
jgi:16S rRNA U516 pseudouridylate synthase RsuA-like enzyme